MGLGSGIRKKPIPDPGVKKVPDPGSGSATLLCSRRCGCTTCLELEARLLGVSPAHIVRVEGEARLRGLRCQVRILPLQEKKG